MSARPRRRTARRIDARWLVTGTNACTQILHHGQQAYLQPVKATDHRARYSKGQRLAVKAYIPGPNEAHVHITSVQGIREAFTLGHVTDTIARELGHETQWQFRLDWIRHNDADWWQRVRDELHGAEPTEQTLDTFLARFEQRWAHKLAWLLRFKLDHTAAPYLLAARSDELYVENPAMALRDELPALRPDEWEQHIGPNSRYREWDRLRAQKAEREAGTLQQRLTTCTTTAKAKGYDVRDDARRIEHHIRKRDTAKAKELLARLEGTVFPVAA